MIVLTLLFFLTLFAVLVCGEILQIEHHYRGNGEWPQGARAYRGDSEWPAIWADLARIRQNPQP